VCDLGVCYVGGNALNVGNQRWQVYIEAAGGVMAGCRWGVCVVEDKAS
jgi:hypothetical protein